MRDLQVSIPPNFMFFQHVCFQSDLKKKTHAIPYKFLCNVGLGWGREVDRVGDGLGDGLGDKVRGRLTYLIKHTYV